MKQSVPENDEHLRPEGVSDETVAGVGKLTEALEKLERARGALYDIHQLVGGVDEQISEAADMLEKAGHSEQAAMLRERLVGINVLPGRWTFQIVEEFDDGYYAAIKNAEKTVRDQLVGGRRHIYSSELKEQNRTKGLPGHEARP